MTNTFQIPEPAINLYNDLVPILGNYTNGDAVWAFGLVLLMIGKDSEPEHIDRALLRLAVIAKSNLPPEALETLQ